MSITKKEKGSGNFLSFLLSGVFFFVVICFTYKFKKYDVGIDSLLDISTFEFIILSLAVFRLTRLLVYDKVAQFIRDLWLNTEEVTEKGVVYIKRTKPSKGIRRLLADLFGCPWCIGVWASLFSVGIYLLHPITWFFFLMMAIAGVSTFIQMVANLVGWHAELGKQNSQRMGKK